LIQRYGSKQKRLPTADDCPAYRQGMRQCRASINHSNLQSEPLKKRILFSLPQNLAGEPP
jgi:hypothetical protein